MAAQEGRESPLLEIEDLSYGVGEKEILKGISLSVSRGEVYALLGANGTGKSTLACLVMGCEGYRPRTGEIRFEGRSILGLALHERACLGICMAWQEPVRIEGLRVREFLTLKDKVLDPSRFLETVSLSPEHYLSRMVDKTLSGGERKRIELASVLAVRPKLAILDEPDSGIDMLSLGDIGRVIDTFRRDGASVLLITHREEVAMVADQAALIGGGSVVFTGSPRQVVDRYKTRAGSVAGGRN